MDQPTELAVAQERLWLALVNLASATRAVLEHDTTENRYRARELAETAERLIDGAR